MQDYFQLLLNIKRTAILVDIHQKLIWIDEERYSSYYVIYYCQFIYYAKLLIF